MTEICCFCSLYQIVWNNLPEESRKPKCLVFSSWADQSHDLSKILFYRSQSWWAKKESFIWSWSGVSPINLILQRKDFFFLNQTSVLLYQEKMCIIVSPDSYYFPHPLQVSSVSFNRILAFSPNLLYRGAFLTVQVTAEQLVLTQKNQRVWVDPVLRLVGQAAWAVEAGGELLVEHCGYPLSSCFLLLTLRDLEGEPEEEGQSSFPNREMACKIFLLFISKITGETNPGELPSPLFFHKSDTSV